LAAVVAAQVLLLLLLLACLDLDSPASVTA
jgi:hypothetical protein